LGVASRRISVNRKFLSWPDVGLLYHPKVMFYLN
jgi:hypothetical protein